MNISIEWPRSRGQASQPLDEMCDSLTELFDDDVLTCEVTVMVPTPSDLAPSRKNDWPKVNPAIELCELLSVYQ